MAGCGGKEDCRTDRKSTRLNSSHLVISYAVFCLKKKKKNNNKPQTQPDINTKTITNLVVVRHTMLRLSLLLLPVHFFLVFLFFFFFFFFLMMGRPPRFTLFPYPTLFR